VVTRQDNLGYVYLMDNPADIEPGDAITLHITVWYE